MFLPLCRPSDIYRRAFIELALRPYAPAMPGDDALHHGETDSLPLEFFHAVQALEHAEQLVGILHVETRAIVLHVVNKLCFLYYTANFDPCWRLFPGELDGVGQQVYPHLAQHSPVAAGGSERLD